MKQWKKYVVDDLRNEDYKEALQEMESRIKAVLPMTITQGKKRF